MEKLLSALTIEVPAFSARDGGKRMAEFYKAHPIASKLFEQQLATEDYYGIKKENINKFFESLAPLADVVYPTIADMFNKVDELNTPMKKGEDSSKMTTAHIWLASKIMTASMLLALEQEMKAVDEGRHAQLPSFKMMEEIEGVTKNQVVKALICKLTFENLYNSLSVAMTDFMEDVFPKPKGGTKDQDRGTKG